MKKIILLIVLSSISLCSMAGLVSGKAYNISFGGTHAPNRPDLVQFSVVGGFNALGDCDPTYAGIDKNDTHLISLLLFALAKNANVKVFLNSNEKYYATRCRVSYLELE